MADTHAYISTPQGIKYGKLIGPPFRFLDRVWVHVPHMSPLPGIVQELDGETVYVWLGRSIAEARGAAEHYGIHQVFARKED